VPTVVPNGLGPVWLTSPIPYLMDFVPEFGGPCKDRTCDPLIKSLFPIVHPHTLVDTKSLICKENGTHDHTSTHTNPRFFVPNVVPNHEALVKARDIDNAQEGDELWDDQIKGLHLRVGKSVKTFCLRYRNPEGRQRRGKLGTYGVLTLSAARDLAKEKLGILVRGEDPFVKKGTGETVKDLYHHYQKVHAPQQQPDTRREYKRIWEKIILKHMGSLKLSAVTEQDCQRLFHTLQSTPVQANRTLTILRAGFNLAEDWGWKPRHTNPVQVKFLAEEARQRYPDPEEAVRLLKALEAMKETQPMFVLYVWLLALTGARPGEIRKAKREWVTPIGLVLPKAKHRKNGRVITLSRPARQIIESIPVIAGNPHLFPGKLPNSHLVGTPKLWKKLLKSAGIEKLQMRDLRRFFASIALSNGATLDQVGQLLGHTQAQTTRRYAYLMNDARLKAVEDTAGELLRIKPASSA
jgi:integrase